MGEERSFLHLESGSTKVEAATSVSLQDLWRGLKQSRARISNDVSATGLSVSLRAQSLGPVLLWSAKMTGTSRAGKDLNDLDDHNTVHFLARRRASNLAHQRLRLMSAYWRRIEHRRRSTYLVARRQKLCSE